GKTRWICGVLPTGERCFDTVDQLGVPENPAIPLRQRTAERQYNANQIHFVEESERVFCKGGASPPLSDPPTALKLLQTEHYHDGLPHQASLSIRDQFLQG